MTPSDWYYSNFKPRPETEIAKTPNFWLKQGKLFFSKNRTSESHVSQIHLDS
jgi:hypothetical protein